MKQVQRSKYGHTDYRSSGHAANVGVETIRYYQGGSAASASGRSLSTLFRRPVGRIRFIKRGWELGLTLAEIGELLRLEDGTDRPFDPAASPLYDQFRSTTRSPRPDAYARCWLIWWISANIRSETSPCPIICCLSDNANV